MVLEEVLSLFLDSRRRGVDGARVKGRPATLLWYEKAITPFIRFLQDHRSITQYQQIRRADLLAYYDWMETPEGKRKPWSAAMKSMALRGLRALFGWVQKDEDCKEAGLTERDLKKYLPTISKTPRKEYIPSLAEIRKFRNSFDTSNKWEYRNYAITCLMLDCGLRVGEVCNLTMEHTKLNDGMLLATGKTGSRVVPISSAMVRVLRSWMRLRETCKHKNSEYTFIGKYSPEKLDPQHIAHCFILHRKKHNLGPITPHTMRHAFCTYYLRNGGSMERLRNITGHSSYEMLKEYLHLAQIGGEEAKQEMEKVSPLKHLEKRQ